MEENQTRTSAGRVQSVALRIIGDREDEINAFIPKEYWTLEADLKIPGEKKPLVAKFHGKGSEKMAIETKEQLDEILKGLENETFTVSEVKKGERSKKAPLPFTTSTLQQEASKVLNFSTQKTMRLAQQLYEGVEVKGKGTIALISYLRTDLHESARRPMRQHVPLSRSSTAQNIPQAGTRRRIKTARHRMRTRPSVRPM